MLALDPARARDTSVSIRAHTGDLAAAVREFNARLSTRGVAYQFPTQPCRNTPGAQVAWSSYLAVDDEGRVRGGYTLRTQTFSFRTDSARVAFFQLPLSEGLIDRRYRWLGVRLLADAAKRERNLYVLGIGGQDEPLARMVRSLGWALDPVPFYFKVTNGFHFARGMRFIRRQRAKRWLMDAAAWSGGAWAAARAVDFVRRPRLHAATSATLVDRFGDETDEIWRAARPHYAMIGARDSITLAAVYPESEPRFLRIIVRRHQRPIGWAVVLDTRMANNAYFGDLRVGTIVDGLSQPREATTVVLHATALLMSRGVDLIVSNQRACDWTDALERAGFFRGPSSFFLGLSKPLVQRLEPLSSTLSAVHVNRGDGDGPTNL